MQMVEGCFNLIKENIFHVGCLLFKYKEEKTLECFMYKG
jgi:hypothetical protein